MSFEDQYRYGESRNNRGRDYSDKQDFQAVSTTIRQLKANVNQIRQMTEALGTSKDSAELRQKFHATIESTRLMAKDANQHFKELSPSSSDQFEEQAKRVQKGKLSKELQAVLREFQETLKISTQKEKSTPLPTRNTSQNSQGSYKSNGNIGLAPSTELVPLENDMIEARNRQMQLENDRVFNEALIADRDKGIREIEKTVKEVNEIFVDLSNLVTEQGEMIDCIESNVESGVAATTQGVQELRAASEYQKKSRTKMCCLALLLIIIIGAAVGLVFFFFR